MVPGEFTNLSLIVFAPIENSDRQVNDSLSALARIRCRTEVILVANKPIEPDQNLFEQISHRPTPKVFPCLSEAMREAKHTIGILDKDGSIDPAIAQHLIQQSKLQPIQTAYHQLPDKLLNAGRLKRIFFWLFSFVSKVLLRTSNSTLRPALTVIHKSSVELILQNQLPTQKVISSTQLLSLARLNGQMVREVNLGIPVKAKATDANSKKLNSSEIRRHLSRTLRYWWNTIMFPRQRHELAEIHPEKKTKPTKQFAISAILMLLAGFVFLGSLGFPLFEPDEARNSQLALNVIETGEWMSLSLGGEYYWDKPPLQIWLIATSYKVFGVSQFATRLPGALASMLTILTVLLAGKRLVGFRSAAIGTALLLLSTGFVITGRYVTMDASLLTATTATLLLGYIAVRDRFDKRTAVFAGVACGIGLLAKGPVIAVLCAPPLVVAAWLVAKEPGQTKTRNRWLWFLIPMCLVAAPWFIAMALIHPEFLTYFFWKHHVVRFSSAFNHQEPFWYYAIGIFLFMFPASYLLPSVVRFSTSRKPENRLWRTKEHGFLFLSAAWTLLFFSLSTSKLPTYILPAFPPICLLMGVLVQRRILQASQLPNPASENLKVAMRRKTFLEGLPRRAPLELLFWISAISLVLVTLYQKSAAPISVMLVSAALLIPFVILAVRKRSNPRLAWTCFGYVAFFAVVLITHRLIPAVSQSRSIHISAIELQDSDQRFADSPIVFFGKEPYGSELTLDSHVVCFGLNQTRKLIEFLKWNPSAIVVSSEEPMERLRDDLPWTISIEQCEDKRHLYMTLPNDRVIAREQNSRLYR